LSVEEAPPAIAHGLAVKELITGRPAAGDGAETTTWVVAVALPASLVAIRVYVVVAAGDTAMVPSRATSPIAWSMLTVVAPETLQLSVEEAPEEIVPGLAPKEPTTGALAASPETVTPLRTSSDQSPLLS